MKSVLSFALALLLLVTFCACVGNYAPTSLNQPIPLPEDGIIRRDMLEEIRTQNAIATFTGQSDGMDFEWKIFGSQLTETHDVDLSLALENTEEGIRVTFTEGEAFGFSAYLSIYLNEKWNALGAAAYSDGEAVASVSLTGSKNTILNLSVERPMGTVIIRPVGSNDTEAPTSPAETTPAETTSSDLPEDTAMEDTSDVPADTPPPTEAETPDEAVTEAPTETSAPTETETGNRPVSGGNATEQDKYKTDPVPEGKPLPVEPENQEINKGKAYTCTFSIECSTILNNLENLDPDKLELVPSNGVILPPTTVTFYEGESVFDVLQRVCKEYNIHLEFSFTPVYNSAYIEGIHNLYEFDCGALSGWMYRVNGWYPNYGCSRYQLADGEVVEWRYTCNDLGKDIGCDWMG